MLLQKKLFLFLTVTVLLIVIFTVVTSKILAEPSPDQQEIENLKTFVKSGLDYIKQNGAQKAFMEISNPHGKFVKGDLYLFVYSLNGICLAIGSNPENLVGKNLYDYRDKYGTPVIKLIIAIAKKGGGFLTYYWPSPKTHNLELKTSYILPINNSALIGAGLYKELNVPKPELVKIEELKAFLNIGIEYYKTHSKIEAYREFSNPKSKFRQGDLYLFIINYQGITLAHGADPLNQIGKRNYDLRDEFNTPFIQLFIETAKSGGGLVSYYWPNPTTGAIQLKTSYVEPLDDESLIGAGIYSTD